MRLALQAMGLRDLKLGFECTGAEDRARGEVTVDRCALSGPSLAEVNFTGRVVGETFLVILGMVGADQAI